MGIIFGCGMHEELAKTFEFGLYLFSIDPLFIREAVQAGVDGVIVDWENIGKNRRQDSFDTQINYNILDDLIKVRKSTSKTVICRLNDFGSWSGREAEDAISAGADELLLPMVKTAKEVESVLGFVRGRCKVGILIETKDALKNLKELFRLPLCRVYVGLNDLAIQRKTPNIFTPLIDGTIEYIRNNCKFHFGFGGLTLPTMGYPIRCSLLIAEMARLRCNFSLLRRSFLRDVKREDLAMEVPRLKEALRLAFLRDEKAVVRQREELEEAVQNWMQISKL